MLLFCREPDDIRQDIEYTEINVINYAKDSFIDNIIYEASGLSGHVLIEKAYRSDRKRVWMKIVALLLALPAMGISPVYYTFAFVMIVLIIGFFIFLSSYFQKQRDAYWLPITDFFPDYRKITSKFGTKQSEENIYKDLHMHEKIMIHDGFFEYSYVGKTKPFKNALYYEMRMFRANIESIKRIRYCEKFSLIIMDAEFDIYVSDSVHYHDIGTKRNSLKWHHRSGRDSNMKKHSTLRLYNYYDQNLLDCFTGVFNMNYEKISESEAVEEMKKHPFSV